MPLTTFFPIAELQRTRARPGGRLLYVAWRGEAHVGPMRQSASNLAQPSDQSGRTRSIYVERKPNGAGGPNEQSPSYVAPGLRGWRIIRGEQMNLLPEIEIEHPPNAVLLRGNYHPAN